MAAQAVKLAAHISDNSLGILSFLFDFDLGGGKGISLFALGVAGGGSLLGGGFGQLGFDAGGGVLGAEPVLVGAVGLPQSGQYRQHGGNGQRTPMFD